MKNRDKYTSEKEIKNGFIKYCEEHTTCSECPLLNARECDEAWMDMDADDAPAKKNSSLEFEGITLRRFKTPVMSKFVGIKRAADGNKFEDHVYEITVMLNGSWSVNLKRDGITIGELTWHGGHNTAEKLGVSLLRSILSRTRKRKERRVKARGATPSLPESN